MSMKKRVAEGAIGAGVGALAGYALQRDTGDWKDKAKAALTGGAIGAGAGVAAGHGIRELTAKHHSNKVYNDGGYRGFTSSHNGESIHGANENHQKLNTLSDKIDFLTKKMQFEEGADKDKSLKKNLDDTMAHHKAISDQMQQHSSNVYNTKKEDLKAKVFGV